MSSRHLVAGLLSAITLAHAPAAWADALQAELNAIRQLRSVNRLADASDRAITDAFLQSLETAGNDKLKEEALWEAADIHLGEANRWPASSTNEYARRAIDAWTAYVTFATDLGTTARLHRGVEYLQRSYLQANEYPGMFSQLPQLLPQYVNDKVVLRWEDKLRACSEYTQQDPLGWVEQRCRQAECRDAVAAYYDFAQKWLTAFPLKEDARSKIKQRVDRVPSSCRTAGVQ